MVMSNDASCQQFKSKLLADISTVVLSKAPGATLALN